MYRFWDTVIEPGLDIVKPEVIVEIGSDHGANTRNLLAFCERTGSTLHVIDPLPKYDISEWQRRYGDRVVFHLERSLDALHRIDGYDAVLIDGDHNWYTVFNELKLIEKKSEELSRPFPLVLLHDVGWPYARRDLYYAPENIPAEYRQPYERGGIPPNSDTLLQNGGLNRHLYNATHEGGPRNGVLTAVEDFMEESGQQFDLVLVPGLHGLGVLVPSPLKQNEELSAFLETLATALDLRAWGRRTEQVELVEQARLEAEIELQEQRIELQEQRKRVERLRKELRARKANLQVAEKEIAVRDHRNAQLHRDLKQETENVRRLMRWIEELDRATTALLGSRQWRVGHAIGELQRRALLKPRVAMATDAIRSVVGNYRKWLRNSRHGKNSPTRPGRAEAQVAGEPGPATTARKGKKRRAKPSISRDRLGRKIRERLGPPPERDGWPLVSIIVLNRNGLAHLRTLFSGLKDKTDYPDFEVVLVDNGSTDGSVKFARSVGGGFPVKLVENRGNVSFSVGNNQGAELADGELLLFLNNDVEPFEPGWLKELVACTDASRAAATGAYLLYPDGVRDTASGYAVQHRGIKFYGRVDFPHYFNLGAGEDALGKHLGADVECPATTAACLLVRREAFDSVGGFTRGYRYGTEDVDLGLKLTASGLKVISSGRAVLFHHEFSTQDTEGEDFKRINRMGNRRLLLERWGPRLEREFTLDRLGSASFWTDLPAHIAITVTSNDPEDGYGDWYTAHEMGDALEKVGWRVTYVQRKGDEWYSLPEGVDYLLVLLETYDVTRVSSVTTIAWIRNWTDKWVEQPWFEKFDVVLASSGISKEIVERRTTKTAKLFPIATNPQRFSQRAPDPTYEADYVFTGSYWGTARSLVEALDVDPAETFMIFGKGWNKVPRLDRYNRGPLPYDQLPWVYSSAKLLLDDAAVSTLPYGSVNSRVFDALATGTLVVTNCEAGVRELFDEDFPTYKDRWELRERLDELLNDDARRQELARRYREIVLREHTYDKRAEQLTELLRERAETLTFCIKIGAPNWEVAPSWGDLHFARAMQRQLERRSHPCLIQTLGEWDNFEGLRYDVAIHLKGLMPYVPKPGQLNVLWNISHPDLVTPRECDKYDLVFVASERWGDELRKMTKTPVYVLEQATDPEVFFSDPDPEHERDLVFVGNSRRVERRILRDLLPTHHDLAVWGGDWEDLIDDRHIAGEHLPNDQVRKAYSSAAIVLNDHWDDMREHGFVSNRIYDALACGSLVVSDHLPEIEEAFGDAVVTYRTPEELRDLVKHYLASPEERMKKGRGGREIVLTHHTFEHRVEELLRHVALRIEETAFPTRIRPSSTGKRPAKTGELAGSR